MIKKSLLTAVTMAAPIFLGANGVFAATSGNNANPNQTSTTVSATFTVPTNGGTNPLPPQGGNGTDTGGTGGTNDNTSNNVSGAFGIAYQPTSFNFGNHELGTTGSATYQAESKKGSAGFHVGVKDTTHDSTGWQLTAIAQGEIFTTGQARITTTSKNTVTKNENDGTTGFQNSNLVPVTDGSVTTNANSEITSVSGKPIMTGVKGSVFSSTYDVDLGEVSLVIPDVSKIKAGSLTASSVQWNLALTPQ